MSKLSDILSLKLENNRLKHELQFAQNFNELLENYRNLMNNCINSCDNCNKNEEIVNKYHYLEINYNKHLEFAKEKDLNLIKMNESIIELNDKQINSEISDQPLDPLLDGFDDDSDSDSDDSEDYINPMDFLWTQNNTNRTPRTRRGKSNYIKNQKVYKCDLCEYTHRKLPNLESHKNKVHLNIRPFKCDKCEKDFTGKPVLDKHKRKVHNESESVYHYCDWTECKFRTKYWNNLKEHKLRHTGDRTFKCCWPGCEKSFYNNKELTQHMCSHEDNKDFKCDWPGCGASFKRAVYLGRHKLLHTCPDSLHPCVWPGCPKSFNTKKKLGKHMAVHKKNQSTPPTVGRPPGRVQTLATTQPILEQKCSPQYPFDLSQRGHSAHMQQQRAPQLPVPQLSLRWPNIPNIHNKTF